MACGKILFNKLNSVLMLIQRWLFCLLNDYVELHQWNFKGSRAVLELFSGVKLEGVSPQANSKKFWSYFQSCQLTLQEFFLVVIMI